MKRLLLLLTAHLFAGSHLGVLLLSNWHSEHKSYVGGSVLLPLSFLMGSGLELGVSFMPDYATQHFSISDAKRYSVATHYNISDNVALLAGAYWLHQNLACVSGCDKVSLRSGRIGFRVGAQWLYPMGNFASGIRVLYNLRNTENYCYGGSACENSYNRSLDRIQLQAIMFLGL